jgi:hypothetical protein
MGERDENEEYGVTELLPSLSPAGGERAAVRVETRASSGEARAE